MKRLVILVWVLAGAAMAGEPLQNARAVFEGGKGHVAFLGGSITQMNGYRPMVTEYLQKKFPDTTFRFTAAGLSSTCSNSGAFRFKEHVLAHGPVDLLFVEFAVNDDQDAAHDRDGCIRGMEGVVRQLRMKNPNADIVMVYFINGFIMKELQEGRTPLTIEAHGAVAERYGVTAIPLAQKVAAEIKAGRYDWKKFGGVHPAAFGNRICADLIEAACDKAWAGNVAKITPHKLPEPVDPKSYFNGRFLDSETVELGEGWLWSEPDWKQKKGGFRKDYANRKLLHTEKSGATLTCNFTGNAVGAFMLAGPDSGVAEFSIDGGPFKKLPTKHRYSGGLHYPRTVMFATGLEDGKHKLVLRLDGKGALRFLHLVAN